MNEYVLILNRPIKDCLVCHGGKFLSARYDYCQHCQYPKVAYWTQYDSGKHIILGRFSTKEKAYYFFRRLRPFKGQGQYTCQVTV